MTDPNGEQPLLVRLDCAICGNLNQTQTVMDYTPAKSRSSRAVFKFTPNRTADGTGLLQFQVTGSSGQPQTVAVQVRVQ